jgi:hypothetical protein
MQYSSRTVVAIQLLAVLSLAITRVALAVPKLILYSSSDFLVR